jgi:hypothetical protein
MFIYMNIYHSPPQDSEPLTSARIIHSFISNTGKGIFTLSLPGTDSGESSDFIGSVTSVEGVSIRDRTGDDDEGKDCDGSTGPGPDPSPVPGTDPSTGEVEVEVLILEDLLRLVGGIAASSTLLLLGTSTILLLLLLLGAVTSTMDTYMYIYK